MPKYTVTVKRSGAVLEEVHIEATSSAIAIDFIERDYQELDVHTFEKFNKRTQEIETYTVVSGFSGYTFECRPFGHKPMSFYSTC